MKQKINVVKHLTSEVLFSRDDIMLVLSIIGFIMIREALNKVENFE